MNFSSKLIEGAVNEFASLPGIGKKTALRLVLHLLKRSPQEVDEFSTAFTRMRNEVCYCKKCFNISDTEVCEICNNANRNQQVLCVVENLRDVIAIENTHQYKGLYHVLGGIISPMDGIGPKDLNVESLVTRVNTEDITEVIMALSPTIEGDTTNFYIFKRLKDCPIIISTIARGIAVGDELEYADEVTLGRSLLNRVPFENSLQIK